MEAEMRTMIATLAGLVALGAVSVQAAPLPPAKATPAGSGAAVGSIKSNLTLISRRGYDRAALFRGRFRDLLIAKRQSSQGEICNPGRMRSTSETWRRARSDVPHF